MTSKLQQAVKASFGKGDTKMTATDVLLEAVEAEVSISGHLLMVAQGYATRAAFVQACVDAETFAYTEGAGELMLDKDDPLPKAWVNAKATLSRAFEYEGVKIPETDRVFHLRDYTSEYNVRMDLQLFTSPNARNKAKEKKERAARQTQGKKQGKPEDVVQGFSKSLHDKVGILLRTIRDITNNDPAKGPQIAETLIDATIVRAQALLAEIVPVKPAMKAVVTGLPKGKGKGKAETHAQA